MRSEWLNTQERAHLMYSTHVCCARACAPSGTHVSAMGCDGVGKGELPVTDMVMRAGALAVAWFADSREQVQTIRETPHKAMQHQQHHAQHQLHPPSPLLIGSGLACGRVATSAGNRAWGREGDWLVAHRCVRVSSLAEFSTFSTVISSLKFRCFCSK